MKKLLLTCMFVLFPTVALAQFGVGPQSGGMVRMRVAQDPHAGRVVHAPFVDPHANRGQGNFQRYRTAVDPHAGRVVHAPFIDPNVGRGHVTRRHPAVDPYAHPWGNVPCNNHHVGNSGGGAPFYSSQLRAQFVVVPSGGRCITQLSPGSPLRRAGIEVGDIITHLDGIPVNSNWELDNHYGQTLVYGIDWRTGQKFMRHIYIP